MATRDYQRGPHHEQTTIDLIFSTIRAIEGCKIVESLDQGSDHLPIELILLLTDNITRSRKPKPLWKNCYTPSRSRRAKLCQVGTGTWCWVVTSIACN